MIEIVSVYICVLLSFLKLLQMDDVRGWWSEEITHWLTLLTISFNLHLGIKFFCRG